MYSSDVENTFQRSIALTPRVKICGMKDLDSVLMAVRHGTDAVGFITEVPVKTHRKIDRDTARSLVAATPPFVSTVMVCMPEDLNNALELVSLVQPDTIQIHSNMSIDDLKSLKNKTRKKVIKTISINDDTDIMEVLNLISRLQTAVDAVLLDSSIGGRSGGTGTVHDWTISKKITTQSPLPVILAGGLHPGNVAEAIRTVAPYGVDTASGAEIDSKKDENKIRLFIEHARGHHFEK